MADAEKNQIPERPLTTVFPFPFPFPFADVVGVGPVRVNPTPENT